MNPNNKQSEGITWISPQSLIQLRTHAKELPLSKGKIHAKQGGAYISSFKGRGMEFDESRQYQPGDDIRNIDWRVTARTGTTHTKVFQEERERPVLLWLDLSPSMFFATRGCFKSVLASKLAALIAWSVTANNDRVGGLVFSADEHLEIKPRRGKSAALNFIGRCCKHTAWQVDSSQQTANRDMASALSRLRKVSHPGSLLFLLSDFREMTELAFSNLANIARHNDVVLIHIYDPIEADLPPAGSYQVSNGTSVRTIQSFKRSDKKQYHANFAERLESIKQFCRKNRIHILEASTEHDALAQLQSGLGINSNKTSNQTSSQFSSMDSTRSAKQTAK